MISISFTNQTLLSQVDALPEFPSAREVRPKITATLQKTISEMKYTYNVTNERDALQNIWIFLVQIKVNNFHNTAPFDWDASNIRRDTISAVLWSALDSTVMIKANSSTSGFTIFTEGLPSIVNYFAVGYQELPEGELEFKQGTNDIFYNSFKGATIGPLDPPTPTVPLAFLDTLVSYKHQALALGWIKNQGIVTSLDAKLNNAKAQLQRNNNTAAKNILQAFINEVEALNKEGNQITSEAYALLKFNAEYLISKL